MSSTHPERPVRTIALTRGTIAVAITAILLAAILGGAAGVAGSEMIEKEDWERSEQVEGAIHDAVESMAREGVLAEGDRFRVVEIQGTVGEHNSPWHITYTALIEKIEEGG